MRVIWHLSLIVLCLVPSLKTHSLSLSLAAAEETTQFPEEKWGTYYDPKDIFCGKYDCYKILGFDYESWGRSPPDRKNITQSYRSLSRKWHPDKNRDAGAKDRFVKISKAYQVLTDPKQRKEYDYMRDRPDEYFYKYGSTVLYHYAPKSDTLLVIIFLILLGCGFTWFAQKQRWQQIADRVVKDAVEGLRTGEGGSTESIELRAKAEAILKERKAKESEPSTNSTDSKKSKIKLTKKEMKERENEELRPIITELVKEINDFGAGFHQPTWRDILIIRMARWPIVLVKATCWETKYYWRRLRKIELNEDERQVLTCRAVGHVAWESASEDDKEDMKSRELWIMANLEEWLEEQQLSSGQQKRYNRWKKKEGSKKGSKLD